MDNLGTEWLTFTLLTRFGGGGGGLLTLGWEGGEGAVVKSPCAPSDNPFTVTGTGVLTVMLPMAFPQFANCTPPPVLLTSSWWKNEPVNGGTPSIMGPVNVAVCCTVPSSSTAATGTPRHSSS